MDKKECPICRKNLVYRNSFSKHGYQIRWNQHTPTVCFSSYKSCDGLLEKYVDFLKSTSEELFSKFPSEWIGQSVFIPTATNKQQYGHYNAYRQVMRDLQYFEKKILNND